MVLSNFIRRGLPFSSSCMHLPSQHRRDDGSVLGILVELHDSPQRCLPPLRKLDKWSSKFDAHHSIPVDRDVSPVPIRTRPFGS
jgi:hypothetical protein